MPLPKNNIANLEPYTCARDLYKQGVFLDANENYQQWVKINWSKITDLNRYPDSSSDELRAKLVQSYAKGFKKDNIFVCCGSDEAIDLLIRGFVENDESIMIMDPSYSVYQVQAAINSVGCKKIVLKPNFSLDITTIKKNLAKVKIIFLCSPNNPTGSLIQASEVLNILKVYKGLIVIDEAYIEFSGLENSLAELIKINKQIVVLRTFSKAWGLANIRLGYVLADRAVVEVLLKIKNSYNVSGVSQMIGLQALDQIDKLKESVQETLELKKKLEEQFRSLGYKIISTQANFILLRIPNATAVYKQLAKKGLIVRDRSNLPYLGNVLRITVGSPKENAELVKAIKQISTIPQFSFDSVIFDMDGVLVDVSKSYRQAIRQTVEFVLLQKFKLSTVILPEDIEALKAIPGFNNDWDLSFALIQLTSKGVKRAAFKQNISALNAASKTSQTYQEIKDIFQSYYLGEKLFFELYQRKAPITSIKGLIANETLLLDLAVLASLAKKYKLGVATSRPRFEAIFTLTNLQITPALIEEKNIVAQEDAAREKPFPDPLLEAKKRLKTQTPVYVGDTVNDLLAAQQATMPCILIGSNNQADFAVSTTNQIPQILL